MRKNLLILLIYLLGTCQAFAQQDPQFSHYMFNGLQFNPALAGTEDVGRFQLIHRQQWSGYQATFDEGGAPTTTMFSFNMPLYAIRSGIGLYVINDQVGPVTNRDLQLSYAYHLKLSPDATLSIGARGGFLMKTLDGSKYRPKDAGDPLIPTGQLNQNQMDFGVGAYYYTSGYYLGASLIHTNTPKYDFGLPASISTSRNHAFFTAGLSYYVSDEIELAPSVLYKTDMTHNALDLNLKATYNDTFWVGGGVRLGEGLLAMAGVTKNNLRLGMAVDFVTNGTLAKSPVSWEALLSYALPVPKPTKKSPIRTPRFRF
jgi:type IX secretion system PorP/SprF family membrane protein